MAKKRTMKHLGAWQKFVMKVKAENPGKPFKEILKLAGKMKRKGVDIVKYAHGKTKKVFAKKAKTMKRRKK
jgi:hypothetical protein